MTNQHQKNRESDLWTSMLRALVIPTKFGVLFLSLVSNLAVQLLLFLKETLTLVHASPTKMCLRGE